MKILLTLAASVMLAGCVYVVQMPEAKAPTPEPSGLYTMMVRDDSSRETRTRLFGGLVECEAAVATLPKTTRLIEKCYPK